MSTKKPLPVDPVAFANTMSVHWENLGNVSSDALVELWEGMGQAFSRAVLVGSGSMASRSGEEHQWQILQPPTGTGKTQGACVYAAMVAKQNRHLPEGCSKTGILMVTRMIKEADGLAATIDELAGFSCAAARHSESKLSPEEMASHDILIITHQAYINALEDQVLERGGDRLGDFIEWDEGRRILTIIDEHLEQLVKGYQVSEDDLRWTYAAMVLDPEIRRDFDWIANDIDIHSTQLTKVDELHRHFGTKRELDVLWRYERQREGWAENKQLITALRKRISKIKYDEVIVQGSDRPIREHLAKRIDKTLEAYEAIGSGFAYLATVGGKPTYNTSKLMIPDELPGPVVLDATAGQEVLWELVGSKAKMHGSIAAVRSYRNVRLHVARSAATGKQSMAEHGESRITRLFDNLSEVLRDKKVFLCVHKAIEPLALAYKPDFADYSVDHWGNIDGRNDWQDCEAAILFGIPFRPQTWAKNKVYSVLGLEPADSSLLIRPERRKQRIEETPTRQLSISIVQAINRIRCRRVIDERGNCPETDVYVVLPDDCRGDEVLELLRSEMPDINVVDWSFKMDGEKKKIIRAAYAEPVFGYMKGRQSGETSIADLCSDLGIKVNTRKDLQADLRNPDRPITRELAAIGVTYHTRGSGRGSRSYLLKR